MSEREDEENAGLVHALGALQLEAGDGGVFVAVVGPVFFWVQLGECRFIGRQFILGRDGFDGGLWEVLRLYSAKGEGLHGL